jgi:hypothetical protein
MNLATVRSVRFSIVFYCIYCIHRSSHRCETSSQTMDIDCVNHQTNAPTNVGTSQKHKVHMTLSLHKSASPQIIHPVYNKMHKIWIQCAVAPSTSVKTRIFSVIHIGAGFTNITIMLINIIPHSHCETENLHYY